MNAKASHLILVLALAATGAAACKKSGAAGGGTAPLALTELGLNAQAPEGSKAEKAIIGSGLMITGPDLVVTVEAAGKDNPKTLAEAKKSNELYSPLNVKEETLPDGWATTFENKGAIGTSYWVQVRRDIGGKPYFCSTTSSSPEQGANALAVCKSLTKA
jgi:hypothetical protein